MFDFSDAVRVELVAALRRTWDEIAGPGTWWTAAERVAIATTGRAARAGDAKPGSEGLPEVANEAATVIGGDPAWPTEDWVTRVTNEIGEERYVELVGIVGRVVAVDTFTRLLGKELEPFPEPRPGDPSAEKAEAPLRKNRTWVSMGSMAAPPFVLAAVPAAVTAMNDLAETMYLTVPEMGDPDFRRGKLHRTQIELVAATVSHANQCFYWTLAHAGMLSWSSSESNRPVELAGIVDATVDPGPPGGAALVALGHAAVSMVAADRAPLEAVAAEIGEEAAVDAASVAGNFELMNRVVDATGLPIGRKRRDDMRAVIETLGLEAFPHASH